MKRLFIAIPLPQEIASQLAVFAANLNLPLKDPRWVPQQNYHVTALFMGDIHEEHLSKIQELIQSLCAQTVPFNLQFRKISIRPQHAPRMIWAKFETTPDFTKFVNGLKRLLMPFMAKLPDDYGVDPIPHLTLVRFRADPKIKKFKSQIQDPDLADIPVQGCQLIASELTPSGPVYTKLAEFEYAKV
jgi:RNA 2',3'-cyclic 3'-phosphodiesterase